VADRAWAVCARQTRHVGHGRCKAARGRRLPVNILVVFILPKPFTPDVVEAALGPVLA
jgi:hypothetical protein